MSARRAYLIDSSIYLFRAWFSLPDNWHSPEGMPVNAVYGYAGFLLGFLAEHPVRDCAAAFDESLGSCFRNDLLPSYKASRELPDEQLAFQLGSARHLTELLGLPCYGGPRYEADDYLATLARLYREAGVPYSVLTRDKDLGQLLCSPDDQWWDYAGGEVLDQAGFTARFGVRPDQFGDYLALVGDPVDDIPGVPGVGAKTAARLLQAYGDLAQLERNLDNVAGLGFRGAASTSKRLRAGWADIQVARQLTGLADRIEGIDHCAQAVIGPEQVHQATGFLRELGLAGPLARRLRALEEAVTG